MRSFLALMALATGLLVQAGAAAADGVLYDLREGSYLLNDCPICDRVSIPVPLRGTFLVTPEPPGVDVASYQITAIDWHTVGGSADHTVAGEGSYSVIVGPNRQTMTLAVTIDGEAGITLSAKGLALTEPWPFLDLVLDEETSSMSRVYHVRLVAAPHGDGGRVYQLSKGSTFTDDCLPCARATIPIPIQGSFRLTQVDADPLFVVYRVDDIDFKPVAADSDLHITGLGRYKQGGEVALLQTMTLQVTTSSSAYGRAGTLDSDAGPPGAVFPSLDVSLTEKEPPTLFHVFSLRIVADPESSGTEFRRGDPNGDGAVDISDAVAILNSLFLGTGKLSCQEAADGNDDGALDISDPVFLLSYLFQGGPPPAEPLAACGADPTPDGLSCDSFSGCR
jgi:hypothetical protein